MESSSRASSVERTSPKPAQPVVNQVANSLDHQLANLIGTIIALLTLTVPLFAIAHFSPTNQTIWQPDLSPDSHLAE